VEKKALGCSKATGHPGAEGQPLFGKLERPTVEGTPGAVEPATFREQAGETALQGKPGESSGSRVSWFERDRNRTVAEHHNLPSDVRH
jgi:hypothetical protein